MGTETKIEWAHHTANLVWGCQEVHEGCDHCYARVWDKRMGGDHWGAHAPRWAIKSVWSDLAKWQQAASAAGETHRVFCGSMMDIFEVSKPVVDHRGNPPANAMYGYSAVNQKTADQGIPALLSVPGRHFLSMEPLLGPVHIESWLSCDETEVNGECCESYSVRGSHFRGVDWVIVGGESGQGARPMHPDWARSIRNQCQAAGIPFFFKQ